MAYAACYVLAALLLLPVFRESLNPDGVSYLAIADKYLRGEVRDAVNAYWGPLYSWLMVPLRAIGLAPLLAARLLGIILGGLAAAAAWRLATVAGLSGLVRTATMAALIPLLVLTTYQALSPDLLLTWLLLTYLALTADERNLGRSRIAVALGVLGGLAYWAKAYGFYFFLAHVAVVAMADLLRTRGIDRRRVVAHYGLALAVFAVLSAAWVGALGWKYGRPMLGSTGAYNRELAAPGSRGHPMHYQGFLAPPNPTAVAAWEDPTLFDLASMRAQATASTPADRLAVVAGNVKSTVHFLAYYTGLPCLMIAAWVARRGWRGRSDTPWRPLAVVGAAAVMYPLGYIPVLVTVRYLLILPILLALVAASFLAGLAPRRWVPALVAALVLGVAVVPARELVEATRPVQGASSSATAARLASVLPRGSRLASNGEWEQSLYVAFRLGCRYHGQRGDLAPDAVPAELARQQVDLYLAWDESPEEAAAMRGRPEIGAGLVAGLRIYVLR